MRVLGFIISISILFSGCQDAIQKQKLSSKHGGSLIINEAYTLDVVNPHFTNNIAASHVYAQVFEGLVKFDTRNLEIIPSIAKSWKVENDHTLFTFHLRTNVYFHADPCFGKDEKGNPNTRKVTARDVKYSLEKYCQYHPRNKNNHAFLNLIKGGIEYYEGEESGDVKEVSGIKIVDDSTLVIELLGPYSFFLNLLANPAIVILPKEGYDMYGDANTIGTGPFMLPNVPQRRQPVTLVRNSEYYLTDKKGYPLPYLDKITFTFIGSTQQELELFEDEELDVVLSLPKKYVNRFLEENMQFFESKPPKFVLHQSKDGKDMEIFNLLQSDVQGFYTNSMNYLDFTRVYFEEPKMVESTN